MMTYKEAMERLKEADYDAYMAIDCRDRGLANMMAEWDIKYFDDDNMDAEWYYDQIRNHEGCGYMFSEMLDSQDTMWSRKCRDLVSKVHMLEKTLKGLEKNAQGKE